MCVANAPSCRKQEHSHTQFKIRNPFLTNCLGHHSYLVSLVLRSREVSTDKNGEKENQNRQTNGKYMQKRRYTHKYTAFDILNSNKTAGKIERDRARARESERAREKEK